MSKSNKPSWLPEIMSVNPFDSSTYDKLYDVYEKAFIKSRVTYCGINVIRDTILEEGRERTFWHLTTRENSKSGEREYDSRRSELLSWLKPMIENSHENEVLTWEYPDGKGIIKVYVWLKDFDYIAIMKKAKNGSLILLTAHWVQYENYKQKLMQKYQDSKKVS